MGFHHIPKPPRIVALGGPVSATIRAMRADEPATDYARIRELRRAIADRIEADIALLDALDPFADEREADFTAYGADGIATVGHSSDLEPSLCGLGVDWPSCGVDDAEGPDDNGVADDGGEQWVRGVTLTVAEFDRQNQWGR